MKTKSNYFSYSVSAVQTTSHRKQGKRIMTHKRFSLLFSLGLHLIAAMLVTAYVVQKTVIDDEPVQVNIVQAPTVPKPKHRMAPHVVKKMETPQIRVQTPRLRQAITTAVEIPTRDARFTLPPGDTSVTAPPFLGDAGLERKLLTEGHQAHIAVVPARIEPPKSFSPSIIGKIESTYVPQANLNLDSVALRTVDLSDVPQSLSDFLGAIRDRIQRAQRYPRSVRGNVAEGTTKVRFTIRRDGSLIEVEVVASSGSKSLDDAALAALREAAPFPPFPPKQNGEFLHLELPIAFQFISD